MYVTLFRDKPKNSWIEKIIKAVSFSTLKALDILMHTSPKEIV